MPPVQPQIDALKTRMDKADELRADTHKMVADMQKKLDAMHNALMEPQLGQGDKSLIERMAEVTVDIESGKRTTDNLIGIARRLAFIGAIIAVIGAFMLKLEFWKGPQP